MNFRCIADVLPSSAISFLTILHPLCKRLGREIRHCFPLFFLLPYAGFGIGQNANSPGIEPFSTQTGSAYDTINLSSSNTIFNFPIRTKGGPVPLSFSLHVAPQFSVGSGTTFFWELPSAGIGMGTSDGTSLLSFNTQYTAVPETCQPSSNVTDNYFQYNNVSIVDETGAAHPIPVSLSYNPCTQTYSSPLQSSWLTTDGSGYTAVLNSLGAQTPPSFTVYDRSGNKAVSTFTANSITTITTPNSLALSHAYTLTGSSGRYTTTDQYQDTLGLTALTSTSIYSTPFVPQSKTLSYLDSSSNPQFATVTYTPHTLQTAFGCSNPGEAYPNSYNFPTTISLPDGRSYTITYEPTPGAPSNVTGRIASITLPTGGSISYTYTGGTNNTGIYCDQFGGIINDSMVPTTPILKRTINDGLGNQSVWTYNFPDMATPYGNTVTQVLDPSNNLTIYHFTSGYMTEEQTYQGSTATPSNLLKTVITCYNGNFSNCATISGPLYSITQTDVYTSYNSGSSSLVETVLNTSGLPTDVKQYDYGAAMPPSGNPVVETKTTYGSWSGSACNVISTYIRDRVCERTVYGPSQAVASDQRNTYDSAGNMTAQSQLTSGSAYVTTSSTYNSNGTLNNSTDANGNVTTYTSANCNNLLPTKTTKGGISTQQAWDCNGAVIASQTGPNPNETTTYSYVDPLYRQTSIQYPDGGKTTTCYSDVGGSLCTQSATSNVIYTSTLATPSPTQQSTVTQDGLGRAITSLAASGAVTSTTYDSVGRVSSVSNPYLSKTDTTYGVTSFSYDALGRVLDQCQADNTPIGATTCSPNNSYLSWSYSGNQQTFRDAKGDASLTIRDGLDRLSSVTEASGAKTTYSYDGLSNINLIQQPGLSGETGRSNRTFTYDSISRLLCASNPENSSAACPASATATMPTAATTYTYDGNGNVHSKQDARAVTTTYGYDALNRLLSKTYSAATPSTCYEYDQSSLATNGGNLVGRLANSWTQAGSCPASSAPPNFQSASILSRHSVLAYDLIGRILSEQQCTKSNCNTSTSYSPAYSYDLAGNLITHSSGIGSGPFALTFTNGYDGAGHLCSVLNGAATLFVTPQYVAGSGCTSANPTLPGYSAAGGLTNATFGTGLQLSRFYDNRLRISSETDTGNATPSQTPGAATITISGTDQTH